MNTSVGINCVSGVCHLLVCLPCYLSFSIVCMCVCTVYVGFSPSFSISLVSFSPDSLDGQPVTGEEPGVRQEVAAQPTRGRAAILPGKGCPEELALALLGAARKDPHSIRPAPGGFRLPVPPPAELLSLIHISEPTD